MLYNIVNLIIYIIKYILKWLNTWISILRVLAGPRKTASSMFEDGFLNIFKLITGQFFEKLVPVSIFKEKISKKNQESGLLPDRTTDGWDECKIVYSSGNRIICVKLKSLMRPGEKQTDG